MDKKLIDDWARLAVLTLLSRAVIALSRQRAAESLAIEQQRRKGL